MSNLDQLGWSHRDLMGQSGRSSVESTSPLEMCTQVQLKVWGHGWGSGQDPPRLQPLLPLESVGQEPSFRCQSQTMHPTCMRTAWITVGDQWALQIQTLSFFLEKLHVCFHSSYFLLPCSKSLGSKYLWGKLWRTSSEMQRWDKPFLGPLSPPFALPKLWWA